MPRHLPPAGTVLKAGELGNLVSDTVRNHDESAALADALRRQLDIAHPFLISSGRAALALVLRTLAEANPARREVVVPGYTCYSVAASAVRAGLVVRPLEVNPDTLDFEPSGLQAIDPDRTLAIVSTSLYGIPANLPALERFAKERGIPLIDDAAQSLGARVDGRAVGTFGDAGILSFDKGKNITSMQGGAILARDGALALRLAAEVAELPAATFAVGAGYAAKTLVYALLLRPWLYWIPNALLTLGETPFELDYPITRFPGSLASFVHRQLNRLDALTASRTENASALRAGLASVAGIRLPTSSIGQAVYPRFPLIFEDSGRREAALRRLRAAGIGATASYPRALIDVPPLQPSLAEAVAPTPRARAIAAGMLTLPTHGYVTERDRDRMVAILGAA